MHLLYDDQLLETYADDIRLRGEAGWQGQPDEWWLDIAERVWRKTMRSKLAWSDGHAEYDDILNPIVRLRFNIRQLQDGRRVLFLEEVQPPVQSEQPKMPRLFVKNWREVGLKWALRHAAELKLDAVAWTPGQVQVDRYDLSKQLEMVEYYPPAREGGHGELVAYNHQETEVIRRKVKPEDLPNWIGKETAAREAVVGKGRHLRRHADGDRRPLVPH